MNLWARLYWDTGFWRVHQIARHALGAVRCWYRRDHDVVWTAGSITPLTGTEPPLRWEGRYCLRCGRTISGKPFA